MIERGRVGRPRIGWRGGAGSRSAAAAWALLLIVTIVGCGVSASPSPSPSPATTGTAAPSDATEGPSATFWPTLVIEGAISLAAADGSFSQMNKDVTTAVNAGDPHTILTVMGDALKFLKANRVAVTYLQGYGPTKATGDKLGAAYDQMIKGAQTIVDAINSGNGPAVQQGFNDFFAGDAAYAESTGALGDLASQATLMKRSYTQ